jgi:hypothetical protein
MMTGIADILRCVLLDIEVVTEKHGREKPAA